MRASRQSLVVPPRQSNLPVLLGAIACGCAGFGIVWAYGRGRPADSPTAEATPPAVSAAAFEPSAATASEPGRFVAADEGLREVAASDRWEPRGGGIDQAVEEPAVPADDRYATRLASLEMPADVRPVSAEGPPLSRFSAADIPPAAESAGGGGETGAAEPESPPVPESPAAASEEAAAAPPPPTSPDTGTGTADVEADHSGPPAALDPATPAAADITPVPSAPAALADGTEQGERTTVSEDPGDVAAPAAVTATPPPAPAPFPVPPAPAPPGSISNDPTARRVLPDTPPVAQPRVQGAAVAMPYAAAPPIVSATDQDRLSGLPGPDGGEMPGQGRPGPMQLEGVQTPQLSVEKRGPREVQVGKPIRYEIIVRNVGSAIAHEVTLRDAVPFGTALVATTPPASPVSTASGAAAEGELLWPLGTLAPGGQARVVMEVMPQVEGEIGSVASVSFRADASVRSRATKPDLRLEATEPKAVLIGRDMQLTIKVTNTGSGIATGVVLEGFLPENVSHRAGKELEFDVGQLRPGESKTIDLVLGSRGPGVHTARLAARADGGLEVQHAVKLEVTAPTLEMAVDMPVRRFLQRPATCTISMVNAGTAPARAIELAAQLPPGMKFVRANNAGWHDERTHRVLWNLEELPPGETGTVEVVVMPVDLGPQKIVAAARSADGLSDQVAQVCEVEGLAALFFEVADSEDPVEVNGLTEYVIRVRNQGTKPATGVRVSASLLGDLEPVDAQGPAAHRVENLTVVFEPLAKLAPSEETIFRVRARGQRAGDQRVQVQVVSADHPTPITKEEITRVYDDR